MIQIVLTGLNGYGGHFVEPLLAGDDRYQLTAVVSRAPEKSPYYEELKKNQVHIYHALEECLKAEKLDMAIITTPMHIHFREVMCALKKGLFVYCEKPLAANLSQCRQIAELTEKTGCQTVVGYQWSHSQAVTALKRDILAGRYGRLQRIKTIAVWNRPKSYYEESDWKGRYYGKYADVIQESVISNAASHFLHNLLFLSGKEPDKAAVPIHICAETYRAHEIETFDTACIRMKTESGCELLYMATLSAKENHTPEFVVECEKADIFYPVEERENEKALSTIDLCADRSGQMGIKMGIAARWKESGEMVYYGSPDEERFTHFKKVISVMEGQGKVNCDVETVLPVTKVCEWVTEHVKVVDFPKEKLVEDGDMLYVEGLDAFMKKCYEEGKLFSEAELTNR